MYYYPQADNKAFQQPFEIYYPKLAAQYLKWYKSVIYKEVGELKKILPENSDLFTTVSLGIIERFFLEKLEVVTQSKQERHALMQVFDGQIPYPYDSRERLSDEAQLWAFRLELYWGAYLMKKCKGVKWQWEKHNPEFYFRPCLMGYQKHFCPSTTIHKYIQDRLKGNEKASLVKRMNLLTNSNYKDKQWLERYS